MTDFAALLFWEQVKHWEKWVRGHWKTISHADQSNNQFPLQCSFWFKLLKTTHTFLGKNSNCYKDSVYQEKLSISYKVLISKSKNLCSYIPEWLWQPSVSNITKTKQIDLFKSEIISLNHFETFQDHHFHHPCYQQIILTEDSKKVLPQVCLPGLTQKANFAAPFWLHDHHFKGARKTPVTHTV